MNDWDDVTLVQAARSGNVQALETLLRRYQNRIYRFSVKMCRNPEDAKDVLQETLLAMSHGMGEFRGAASMSTWLYTIARSFAIKMRRRSKFAPPRMESLENGFGEEARQLPDPARNPEQQLCARELGEALDAAVEALDPAYREVLLLRDAEGRSTAEVSRTLGLTEDAVKSRLHRARIAVRDRVAAGEALR
jgi:RNA polymerase sigma-70 factor (ECF subfamily)